MLALYAALLLLASSISAFVLLHKPRRAATVTFALFGISVAAWAAAIGLAYNPATSHLLFARLTFLFASLMVLSLVTFFSIFPSLPLPRGNAYRLFLIASSLFSAASLSPLLVHTLIATPSGPVLHYGPLHRPFALFVYASFAIAFFALCRRYRSSSGLIRLQFRYLFLGLLLPAIGVTITNLLLPILLGVSTFGRYGPAFALVVLALTAHALIHQRLLTIRLVISRGAGYSLSVLLSILLCVPLVSLLQDLLSKELAAYQLWPSLLWVLPTSLVFPPIHRLVQKRISSYLNRDTYDYQRTLREVMHAISTTLDLHSLARLLCDVIDSSLHVDRVYVYLRGHTSSHFSLHAHKLHHMTPDSPASLMPHISSDVVAVFAMAPLASVRDHLAAASHAHEIRAYKQLQRLDAECAQVLSDGTEAVGLILLGAKRSADPYFQADLDLLNAVTRHAAIAIKNTHLYQELLRVHNYVENILATMESGVVAVNTNAQIVLFNKAASSIIGLQALLGNTPPVTMLPPQLASALAATLGDGLRRPSVETMLALADGAHVPTIYSISPLRDQDDSVVGAVAVFSDLTKLKHLESEKARIERLASIGALASGIAHEIKNPLVAIRTFAELLPERFQDEEFRQDFSRIVVDEIDRIDDLVGRLRGLASPSHQPLITVDVCRLVDDTLALLRTRLEQCHISWTVEHEQDQCVVTGDPARLKQLILNLLVNAIEAMPSGGSLTTRVLIRENNTSQTVSIEVSDTGPGIPDHLLSQIFEPFVTTKATGSGLGLSICRGIADSHGARIIAHNRQDLQGATFLVTFPVSTVLQNKSEDILLHRT